ncbi:MAG: hypothetical protein ABSB33_04280 [Tepidisphaeraceae bacterium]
MSCVPDHRVLSPSPRSSAIVGICVGVAAAVAVISLNGGRVATIQPHGPMISECDGRIGSIVIQYVRGADFATPIYRQLLLALPADVHVYAVCPDQNSFDELKRGVGASAVRLEPILTGHPMTAWSRDRWIALAPARFQTSVTLLAPCAENGAEIWPQRLGDQRTAEDLSHALPAVRADRSGLFFDGGDLLADSQSVFVSPAAIRRNIQHTCPDRAELARLLAEQLQRNPILLNDAPDHHVGMFLMAAGEGRVVVGDPRLAKPLLAPIELPGGPDFSASTQGRFDSVAAAAAAAGYRVMRIPCVASSDGKTFITYVNGLIDRPDGCRVIYLPIYEGQDHLNAAAQTVWQNLGYRVVPIDVTSAFRYFGTLHCLVNVIEKT